MSFRSATANQATITFLDTLATEIGKALNAHQPPTTADFEEVAKLAETIQATAESTA